MRPGNQSDSCVPGIMHARTKNTQPDAYTSMEIVQAADDRLRCAWRVDAWLEDLRLSWIAVVVLSHHV